MSDVEDTAPEQRRVIGRPFVPGQSGNPAGRPKGARSKLAEVFLKALLETFEEAVTEGLPAGKEALKRMRDAEPAKYAQTIASVIPKEITGEDGGPIHHVYSWADPEAEPKP